MCDSIAFVFVHEKLCSLLITRDCTQCNSNLMVLYTDLQKTKTHYWNQSYLLKISMMIYFLPARICLDQYISIYLIDVIQKTTIVFILSYGINHVIIIQIPELCVHAVIYNYSTYTCSRHNCRMCVHAVLLQ